jgi:DNA-binding transcriptional MerR regulator
MDAAPWTIDELASRVAGALADDAYPGAPNGRVRDVPDQRAIRWYATRGLVDRPAAMRGRTALYGQRHLLQLVAVKRLQARGHSLAEVQAQLAGATDETLSAIAELPAGQPAAATAPDRQRFWAEAPAVVALRAEPPRRDPDTVEVLAAVPLEGGALLLVPATGAPLDVPAIRAAARPLLDLLAAQRLTAHHP